jgi:hypothetical protein
MDGIPQQMKKIRNDLNIHSDILFWEMFFLDSQAYAELIFIHQGLVLKRVSFSDLMKEVT